MGLSESKNGAANLIGALPFLDDGQRDEILGDLQGDNLTAEHLRETRIKLAGAPMLEASPEDFGKKKQADLAILGMMTHLPHIIEAKDSRWFGIADDDGKNHDEAPIVADAPDPGQGISKKPLAGGWVPIFNALCEVAEGDNAAGSLSLLFWMNAAKQIYYKIYEPDIGTGMTEEEGARPYGVE